MSFLQNKKSTLSYIIYMGPKDGANISQRMLDLRATLDSLVASQYYTEHPLKPNTEVFVAPVSISVINDSGLGDSSVFSIVEELEDSEISCDFRVEHIKDPQDDYIDNMDEIFYPGKMSFLSSGSDFYYEKCLHISVEGLPSRPVLLSVLNDGDLVSSNHLKQIRDYISGGNKFVALIPEDESGVVTTIVTSFYYKAFRENPNNTLINSLEKTSQEQQCEEMIIKV